MKYRAFISYSHRDDKWATWLHRSLETYRPPKAVVGTEGDNGRIPARLSPIFRDRDELPSATDLGEKISAALRQSACLIVICSPAAAQSPWVNEEILAFKRLGREARVFCLIVGGEPYAEQHGRNAAEECFPKALRFRLGPDGELSDEPAEPIAADAREGKDGRSNAKLKLIAGMLGVGFDSLKQREHHRRQRRLVAIASAAMIGMIITTALATAALFARAEAERQRIRAEAEAETARQTAGFMVDLFRVSDPGEARGNSITAREILDRGADRIETELSGEPGVQATLMDTVGTVYMSLGLYEQAQPLLEGALVRRSGLVGASHPESALTQAHLAELLRLRADYAAAEINYLNALEVQRQTLGPQDPAVADTLAGLAELYSTQGNFEPAETVLREALEIRRENYGDEHADVADAMEELAIVLQEQGELGDSIAMMEDALAMQRRVWDNRPHPALAEALNNLGFMLYDQGDYSRVEQLFEESLTMKRALLGDAHPEIAVALNNLAFVLHDDGELDEAEVMYRQALEMHGQIVGERHPDYAIALNNLAFLLYDKGELDGALETAGRAVDIYRELFPEGHPELAATLSGVGAWYLETGNVSAAEPAIAEALEMRRALFGAGHPDVGNSLVQLGLVDVARGRYQEALDLASEARELLDQTLMSNHWRSGLARVVEGAALTGLEHFISVVSHELKTPVSIIKGYAGTLRRQDANWSAEVIEDSLIVIEEEADALNDLIDSLLEVSRLQAGTFTLEISDDVLLPELASNVSRKFSNQ